MQDILRVTWQVAPLQCPLPWRHCSRCKSQMPFRCSMKFRTNAQKKRIDVWLIYRCDECGETWNMPILERVTIGDIAPDEFQAIARNDPALAARHAFDRERLAHHSSRVENSSGVTIHKSLRGEYRHGATIIEIALAFALSCQIRLDRLLSSELGVTRSRLRALHDCGALRLSQAGRKALRSPAADGQSIAVDLRGGAVHPELAAMIRRRAAE